MKAFQFACAAIMLTCALGLISLSLPAPQGRISEDVATEKSELTSYPDEDRQFILEAVNRERALQGARPLAINSRLNEAARRKARAMIEQGFFSHTGPNGSRFWVYVEGAGYVYAQAGENLSEDYSAEDAMTAWIASPAHYRNIINPDFEEIGIWAEGRYIVQMFGQRQD